MYLRKKGARTQLCKGPEVGANLVYSRNRVETRKGGERGRNIER